MNWLHGWNGPVGYRRLSRKALQEPFTPRLPRSILERPAIAAAFMAVIGIFGSWIIISRMESWPVWTIFPVLIASVVMLSSTVVGLGMLVVLGLQPILGSRELNWHAEPVAVLGLPLPLQRKCESMGFWTCESMVASIESRRFPWTSLEFDERMQVERAISRWHSATMHRDETGS